MAFLATPAAAQRPRDEQYLRDIQQGPPRRSDHASAAEVLVLFSAPTGVESVRFVAGDESLRQTVDAIRAASFGRMFPDDSPAKILRHGVLTCARDTGCSLTLTTPNSAIPVK